VFSSQTWQILKRSYYKNYCIDHNQILHSDNDPQVLTVDGPNMPQTNPRWLTAAILKNQKILIYSQMIDRLVHLQGAPIKINPLGKINYLSYFNRFFHQIYSFWRGGFRPHSQQISLQYLFWFKNYHYLNSTI